MNSPSRGRSVRYKKPAETHSEGILGPARGALQSGLVQHRRLTAPGGIEPFKREGGSFAAAIERGRPLVHAHTDIERQVAPQFPGVLHEPRPGVLAPVIRTAAHSFLVAGDVADEGVGIREAGVGGIIAIVGKIELAAKQAGAGLAKALVYAKDSSFENMRTAGVGDVVADGHGTVGAYDGPAIVVADIGNRLAIVLQGSERRLGNQVQRIIP